MWDLIVSVPDHCLSFYFPQGLHLTINTFPAGVSYIALKALSVVVRGGSDH